MIGRTLLLLAALLAGLSVYLVQHTKYTVPELRTHLKGKVVLVCGASSGIGAQLALKYAEVGAALVLSARSVDKLTKVREACLEQGASSVTIIPQDFSLLDQLGTYREKVLAVTGEVDIVVLNHAAIPLGPWLAVPRQRDPRFVTRVFNINVLSYVELTNLFVGDLERTGGQIHVTSSISATTPFYHAGLYSGTKHALNGFFYSLQQELLAAGSPVTVSVFSLGLIMTPELDTLVASQPGHENIPDLVQGRVGEAAEILRSAALDRPHNLDYPLLMVKVGRFVGRYVPYFNELTVWGVGVCMGSYEEVVGTHQRLRELGDSIQYQQGNN